MNKEELATFIKKWDEYIAQIQAMCQDMHKLIRECEEAINEDIEK